MIVYAEAVKYSRISHALNDSVQADQVTQIKVKSGCHRLLLTRETDEMTNEEAREAAEVMTCLCLSALWRVALSAGD
jgi:hypothetical protein